MKYLAKHYEPTPLQEQYGYPNQYVIRVHDEDVEHYTQLENQYGGQLWAEIDQERYTELMNQWEEANERYYAEDGDENEETSPEEESQEEASTDEESSESVETSEGSSEE